MKISAVLFVPSVEEGLSFWVDRLGFNKTVEVPEGESIGFAILERDGAEVMLQSYASADKDSEASGRFARSSRTALFVEVPDFGDALKRLAGYPVEMPVRDTFYGMREFGVLAPGGHLIVLAAPVPKQ
jgi:uncharacterized glyoxalase superfamily protein PhnB